MHKLPLSFALLTYSGFWRPEEWPVYSLKYWLYNAYSVFMILLLYTFTFCAMVDSVISKDLKTMTDKFSLFISVFGVCFKVANLFLKRERIIDLVNVLSKENCVPRDEQEAIIQRKFDAYERKLTIYCEILNESATWFATVVQFDKFLSTRTLPVSNWVPYDISSRKVHVMSLLHQTLGLMICANASVANETLIAGLMIQVGAQFEIFCHRARILPVSLIQAEKESTSVADLKNRRKRILGELVEHHLEVYKFAHTINTVFQYMIFLQFSISSTVLCLTIYKTSTTDSFDADIVWNFSYLCCMLMQVYLYCWFGNEVTLKSTKASDAIYEMDWTVLPVDVMKDLLIIMTRTKRTLQMSSGHVVTLSTGSFMTIMKITYSSYNILTDSSPK
ncbi:odorant receptor Or1 [Andrena cerasifolii]|uniref:odorant receptor Or1 n=1 Tax=Andrena cerasifolii TaxID=2819439 RepID=UPI00403801DA